MAGDKAIGAVVLSTPNTSVQLETQAQERKASTQMDAYALAPPSLWPAADGNEKAKRTEEEINAHLEQGNALILQGNALIGMAQWEEKRGQYSTAEDFYGQAAGKFAFAAKLFDEAGDKLRTARALAAEGLAWEHKGDYLKAVRAYSKSDSYYGEYSGVGSAEGRALVREFSAKALQLARTTGQFPTSEINRFIRDASLGHREAVERLAGRLADLLSAPREEVKKALLEREGWFCKLIDELFKKEDAEAIRKMVVEFINGAKDDNTRDRNDKDLRPRGK